ncbi:hemolysin III family protein [soil metagenome]
MPKVVHAGPRPTYRGVSHRIAFHCAYIAGIILVAKTHSGARGVVAVYAACLTMMFGVSATLHRADWKPRAFGWLRRADHAAIFAAIAGTYTPFAVLGLGGETGHNLLVLAWVVSGAGMLRALLWPHAPRAITASCFVAAGWVVVAYLPEFHAACEPTTFLLIAIGGVLFTLSAVVYLIKWPDPWPQTFGYHEIFHIAIIVSCAWHFAAVARLAT